MGELLPEFDSLGPLFMLNGERSSFNGFFKRSMRVSRRMVTGKGSLYDDVASWIRSNEISIVYSNTITNGPILEPLGKLGYPIITHVHELEFSVQHIVGLENFRRTINDTRHYVAASQAVRDNLVKNHGIPNEKIDVVHEFLPVIENQNGEAGWSQEPLRQALNIPPSAMVVAASGTTNWRKGTDIFIHIARSVHHKNIRTPIYFVWVGGENTGRRFAEFWHDVKSLGLEKYVRFTGTVSNAL